MFVFPQTYIKEEYFPRRDHYSIFVFLTFCIELMGTCCWYWAYATVIIVSTRWVGWIKIFKKYVTLIDCAFPDRYDQIDKILKSRRFLNSLYLLLFISKQRVLQNYISSFANHFRNKYLLQFPTSPCSISY